MKFIGDCPSGTKRLDLECARHVLVASARRVQQPLTSRIPTSCYTLLSYFEKSYDLESGVLLTHFGSARGRAVLVQLGRWLQLQLQPVRSLPAGSHNTFLALILDLALG